MAWIRPGMLYLVSLLVVAACASKPPSLERAMDLYRAGKLNEARREMAAYARAKPYNPETKIAAQHIVLIRRIKNLESIAIEHWRQGNLDGAQRVLGVMRFLHPTYVDSNLIAKGLDFTKAPPVAPTNYRNQRAAPRREIEPGLRELTPYLLAILDRHEELIIHLAREWELVKYREGQTNVGKFTVTLSSPATISLLTAIDQAYLELANIEGQANGLIRELSRMAEQFDNLLIGLATGESRTQVAFEYEFHGYKRRLLRQILTIKHRLGANAAPLG